MCCISLHVLYIHFDSINVKLKNSTPLPDSLEMEEQVNPLERDHFLSVVLPGGMEKNATVHGSKPVMDLLVTLCATYHLNPSDYTVEVLSPNKNNISFKPNCPIGSLEAERIVLKPKMVEEKIRKPYMPEATVRLLINYNKSHKAVVRVNPRVPLETLLPLVCDKCEFKVETTVLLRDCQSKEPLDVTKTLNDHGLREVFARDAAGKDSVLFKLKEKKQKENAGFLSLFRRKKKKPEMVQAVSAPTSPGLSKQMAVSMSEQDVCSSDTLQADMPKKRRAPQPPMGASQSVPNNLSTCHLSGNIIISLTKRRAPPPPCATMLQEPQEPQELHDLQEPQEPQELQELQVLQEPQELQELHKPHDLQEPQELHDLHDLQEPQELQDPRELQELQAVTQQVTGKIFIDDL
uniref:Cordon-bleu ubiquitin-like domain-containing protein n=1 Tax=Seriola lalandi dorsalis TaxID=1841481 RepID=A0A3B4ZBY8_SERLL